MNVTEAVQSRRSVRAFLDTPVEREILARILEKAQRSPSGGNTQPWHGILLTGDPLQKLFDRIAEEFPKGRAAHAPEYHVYPPEFWNLRQRELMDWANFISGIHYPQVPAASSENLSTGFL